MFIEPGTWKPLTPYKPRTQAAPVHMPMTDGGEWIA
jgi:hypothetical protein